MGIFFNSTSNNQLPTVKFLFETPGNIILEGNIRLKEQGGSLYRVFIYRG